MKNIYKTMNAVNFILLAVTALAASSSADCDACLQNICYNKSIVLKNTDIHGGIDVYRKTNTLYFQYSNNYVNAGVGLDNGRWTNRRARCSSVAQGDSTNTTLQRTRRDFSA
ncbi:hypothetical protein JYU34_015668 [Plutella xylostella]|uniref:Uncharacterized protein n=1 Tax=Plutella xylostella TaxID=51655 RepID=A0ABQ7Q5G1_PLUXY|nr:hypothetical protein JYU34_015668 [Plutella xylostella]